MSIFLINALLANDDDQPTDLSNKSQTCPPSIPDDNKCLPYQSNIALHKDPALAMTTKSSFFNQYSFYLNIFSTFPKIFDKFVKMPSSMQFDSSTTSNSTVFLSKFNLNSNSLNIEMNSSTQCNTRTSSPRNADSGQFDNVNVDKYFHFIDNLCQSQDSVEEIVKSIKLKRRNFAEYIKILYLNEPSKFKLTNGGDGIVNPFRKQSKTERDKLMDKFCTEMKTSYQCKICSKSFPSKKHMQRHIRSHGVNFDWLCKYCFKPFIDSYDLKRHTRVHTGVQPYKCQTCTRKFSQRCSLESHQVKIHGLELNYLYKERRNKLYPCEICSYSTSFKATWLSHIAQEHPNSLYAKEELLKANKSQETIESNQNEWYINAVKRLNRYKTTDKNLRAVIDKLKNLNNIQRKLKKFTNIINTIPLSKDVDNCATIVWEIISSDANDETQ